MVNRRDRRSLTAPECEVWDLDFTFFTKVAQWTKGEGQDLDVIEVIEAAINLARRGKHFISSVPRTPFPARGLALTLGQVMKFSTVRPASESCTLPLLILDEQSEPWKKAIAKRTARDPAQAIEKFAMDVAHQVIWIASATKYALQQGFPSSIEESLNKMWWVESPIRRNLG